MKAKDLPALNKCVSDLMTQLIHAQDALRLAEGSCGTGGSLHRLIRLREHVAAIEKRLGRAERLQAAAAKKQEMDELRADRDNLRRILGEIVEKENV